MRLRHYCKALRAYRAATDAHKAQGNQCAAAKEMGVHRNTLLRMVKRLDLSPHAIGLLAKQEVSDAKL